jgi:asparagine synthase (glutamine-hydrolysing)
MYADSSTTDALDQFLTLEYIPWPRTIFEQVEKLPPGHRLLFRDGAARLERYWEIPRFELTGSRQEHAARLRELLDDAVRARLVSDVPLGAFLSGGIDSSTIVALMSRHMREPVKTFSIGFGEASYNEVAFARETAAAFGTDHREEVLQPDIAEMAHSLVAHFDEPFADFSVFPTYLVSRLARESVKVVLSGDGGDEVLAGYDTYVAQAMDRAYRWLPAGVRQGVMPALANRLPPQRAKKGAVNKIKRFVEGAALPAELQHTRWMLFLAEAEKARLYRWDYGATAAVSGVMPFLQAQFEQAAGRDPLAEQQYVDIKTYLAEDILTKVDRMSMRASLEARVPFLDHRLVEFAVNLPPEQKLHRGVTKVLLREAMAGILPETVLHKPKEGFSIPIKHWLRDSLKPLMQDLLAPDLLARRGYFNPAVVGGWIGEHLDGRANHSHRLWALMVFEIWYRSIYE